MTRDLSVTSPPSPTRAARAVLAERGGGVFVGGLAMALALALGACGTESTAETVAAPKLVGHAEGGRADAGVALDIPTAAVTATVTLRSDIDDVGPDPTAADGSERSPSGAISDRFTLRVPGLGVSAPVVPIAMTASRVLWPPDDPAVLGWWSQGAPPGAARGSAVLVGHSTQAGTGALDPVGRGALSIGEVIELDGGGASLTYRVDSVEVLSKDELPREAERVFDQTGPGRLVIVTCSDYRDGAWQTNTVAIATPA